MPVTHIESCPECKGAMRAVVPNSKPQAAEWYCEKCHKSVPMNVDARNQFRPAMQMSEMGPEERRFGP